MSSSIAVRIVVDGCLYTITCNPKLPGSWLLSQVKHLYSKTEDNQNKPCQSLFNRSKQKIVNLQEEIGNTISMHDVVEVYDEDLMKNGYDNGDSYSSFRTELFFQQLQAFQIIGKQLGPLPSKFSQKEKEQHLLQLMNQYFSLSQNDIHSPRRSSFSQSPSSSTSTSPEKSIHSKKSPRRRLFHKFSNREHRGSTMDTETDIPEDPTLSVIDSDTDSSSPYNFYTNSQPNSLQNFGSDTEQLDTVFDIVFTHQSLGMKLGSDSTKKYAIVRECFENTEASRYPEIQTGVIILAVNGEGVDGIGLSRILTKLREAPRPVVVRFGKSTKRV